MSDMTAEQALKELKIIEGITILIDGHGAGDWGEPLMDHYSEEIETIRQALSAPMVPEGVEDYDAGLLNDYGGGNVSWWHDYIRYEVDKANDWWRQQIDAENTAAPAPAEPAQDELAKLREENVSAMREASSLAISIWRQHYKDVSPNFELCDSVAGIITQIDNMAAGLSEKIVEREAELATLRERVKVLELTAGYASHDIDNIALLLRGEEDLQKLCRGIAERLRLGEGR